MREGRNTFLFFIFKISCGIISVTCGLGVLCFSRNLALRVAPAGILVPLSNGRGVFLAEEHTVRHPHRKLRNALGL
jgi:hypothetical protein